MDSEKVTHKLAEKQLPAHLWSENSLQGIPLRDLLCKSVHILNDPWMKFKELPFNAE